MSDNHNEENPMGWPRAIATVFGWIALILVMAIMAQCDTGRIW